jgi:hypothetical protein
MAGYVYVFKMIGTNFYKIGMTNTESVKSRLDNFKVYAPNGVEVIQVIATKTPSKLEKKLHIKYESKRMKGEFFNLDDNDLNYLECLQDEKTIELKNYFWTYIFDNNITIEDVKYLFLSRDNYTGNGKVESIINHIKSNLLGNELTCTEIKKLLQEDCGISINTKSLGSILKNHFQQKIKKIEGVNHRVYLLY